MIIISAHPCLGKLCKPGPTNLKEPRVCVIDYLRRKRPSGQAAIAWRITPLPPMKWVMLQQLNLVLRQLALVIPISITKAKSSRISGT